MPDPEAETIRQLADDAFRRRVERAREMDPAEKLVAGIRVFRMGCDVTREGIRNGNPDLTETEVESALKKRLQLERTLSR